MRFSLYFFFIKKIADELSPVLVSCPSNIEVSTSQQETEVTWDPPEFFEPTGDPLDISCNYDNGMATLAIDTDHLIECRATNQDNGKTTSCSFIISVKSKLFNYLCMLPSF